MGHPIDFFLAPNYANLFMGYFEHRYVFDAQKNHFCSRIVKWYIDDIFCIFLEDKNEVEEFVSILNNFEEDLELTLECNSLRVHFLDMWVQRNDDKLITTLYTWLFFGTQRRRSHFFSPRPLPYFPCLLSCLSRLIYWETLSALLSKLKKLWIWSTGLSTQLTPSAKATAGKSTLGRALQCDALAFLPHSTDTCWLQTITHTHIYAFTSPPPIPRLRRFEPPAWQAGLWLAPGNGCRSGWLLARAGLLPLLQSRVSMVYYVLLLLRCFSCSHTVLPKEHSLGVIFFSLPSSCYAVFFFNSLSSCPVYPLVIYVCCVWTGWWLISLVLVTSDNKGLLLH